MSDVEWWRTAAIYQVYIRSFADGDGDGFGDIAGIRARLGYLAGLGVDAIWITPWYESPNNDGGYDVSDYRAIAREYGDVREAERLIAEAHQHGLRVILDVVPNHTSTEHPWFQAALASPPGSPERARYHFLDGEVVPNDWRSTFGGPAWTRVPDGQWYLHLFDPSQADLNWSNPEVRAEFLDILRFWFDRGVDGFRIDVATGLIKHPGYPDLGYREEDLLVLTNVPDHPHRDRDEVHAIYRDWRAVADAYDPPRVFVAEAWVQDPERLARYVAPAQLHTAFNFPFLQSAWDAGDLFTVIDSTLRTMSLAGAPPTWVLSNHDVERTVTRYGRSDTRKQQGRSGHELGPVDEELGRRRARAALLLMLALPGVAYLYQGEELGLPDHMDIPDDRLQDPIWTRSGGRRRGRDGCRVPLPWTAEPDGAGFGSADPWLPQPPGWERLSVRNQLDDPASTYHLVARALRIRGKLEVPQELEWVDRAGSILRFLRGPDFECVVNLGPTEVPLPENSVTLLRSDTLDATPGPLGPDTAAWLRRRD
ncbi:alpha-glucosidase [Nonomuraea sp. K274]|uniref:Alpha-glucosidase n=1 Tax=Nonomuraea cypriaca TaxID=1187855 RepID=A0A931EYX6_9ACTN|nr:alpha-amylase family glycosyl hydrolase [Nonomuraea cypriaca]MBF8189244.1 alpha-glucosidase [Nonomuraea cypriaca]